jgi:two-component system sensor histidine kinase DesK
VLREGVTNVIRHSGSRNCWVSVGSDCLEIEDDGRGPVTDPALVPAPLGAQDVPAALRAAGSGLAGLSVRAAQVGALIAVGAGPRGGTLLSVRRTA